jgi:2-methylisocitrate lyase-like PEP mutase family enzyme
VTSTNATASDVIGRPARLRAVLASGEFVLAPGVFDMISAKLADRLNFSALYMTGYGVVASHLGLPDAGIASYTDMVSRVERICALTKTPLIADADTGYGGLLNVHHTVRGYEAAGAAGIQLEDQEFPKKCGHTPGRRVIPTKDMVRKIQVATEARRSEDFLIVARTDARSSLGLVEALRRAEEFQKAGADVLFIEAPESETELEQIGRSFDVPLLVNMVEGGKTPVLSCEHLRALGFRIAIFPATGFLAAAAALDSAYRELQTGSSERLQVPLFNFDDMNRLMGFEAIWEFERKHAS